MLLLREEMAPNLTWRQLLEEIRRWKEPIFVGTVAKYFGIPPGEASLRMHNLRKWGMVKFFDRVKKGYAGFVVTEYGKGFDINQEKRDED